MSFFESLGQSAGRKRMGFDINLLPMNLSDGRNIGKLSGLFLFTAPSKKVENSRQSDVFIVLFHVDNTEIPESQMQEWGEVLSSAYFSARGSLTMGVTAAVKVLSEHIAKMKKGPIMPVIFLNIAILREKTLLAAHAGPVNTTVISSTQVQNFCDPVSLPLQLKNNDLSFFTSEVRSEDIILLCPYVPNDWTNASIMEVTGDSPLNAIRFLLDRSGGNLKAAVIQLKTGSGQISFRTKTAITTNIRPEFENKMEAPLGRKRRSSEVVNRSVVTGKTYGPEKPLIRKRKTADFFGDPEADKTPDSKPAEPQEASDTEKSETSALTGERELPGSESLGFRFKELPSKPPEVPPQADIQVDYQAGEQPVRSIPDKQKKPKGSLNFGRLFLIILCGLLIPIVVVSALFFVYSGRGRNQIQRENLAIAVNAAQGALKETDPKKQESLWTESLTYSEQALSYGKSQAAMTLRQESLQRIDRINGGISTVYSRANQTVLPQGLNITEIAASGQYTYALDSTSGSVFRFVVSGSGLSLDSTFSCTPGVYKELNNDKDSVKVGALVDFTVLPAGNPHSFVLAGIDADANILYCSGFKDNQAGKLIKPYTEKFSIDAITLSENALYVLDTEASAVWEFIYSKQDGFSFEPSNFYGSYSPYLSDVIDFTMYKDYAYFLKSNGTMLICDYTGYRPDCRTITDIADEVGNAHIDLSLHRFRKIMVNSSPDNSIYIMDSRLQSLLNLSVKGNFIRYIVPNRSSEDISQTADATGFGITGQNRLLWGYKNDLYIGYMP